MSYTTSRPIALEETPDGWEKLPYHVAIVPVDGDKVDPLTVDRDGVELSYQFNSGSDVDGQDDITLSLSRVLSENVFNRVSVCPRQARSSTRCFGAGGLEAYWVAAAREAKADLLLDVDTFSYPSAPKSSGLLQSYLLFFTGPLELMFPDREYAFEDMSLALSLYDVGQLASRSGDFRAPSVAALRKLAEAGPRAEEDSA